jgi:hypothetical protein
MYFAQWVCALVVFGKLAHAASALPAGLDA